MPKLHPSVRNKVLDESLHERYDELNQAITEAEAHLRKLRPVNPVWYTFDSDEIPDGTDIAYQIGLIKSNEKWCLYYCEVQRNIDGHEDNEVIPLVSVPIIMRVKAAKHIPKLEEEIVKAKEEFGAEVDATLLELKAFINKN